jgi:hypothetical protein
MTVDISKLSNMSRTYRRDVAQDPTQPDEVIQLLSQDRDEEVRTAVARNPAIGDDLMRLLAEDPDLDVRWRIATRLDAPVDVLLLLGEDPVEVVRQVARQNPAWIEDPIEVLFKKF